MSAPEINLYDECTEDEKIAYEMGWDTARAIDRAAAFDAIRRVVAEARKCDPDWERNRASAIRYAIRVAIESEKI